MNVLRVLKTALKTYMEELRPMNSDNNLVEGTGQKEAKGSGVA